MNLRAALFGIFSVTLFALGVWITILFNVDPLSADRLTYIAFICSLFLWLAGIITLVEFAIRVWMSHREIVYANFPIAVRHGSLISLTCVTLLSLQLMRVLNLFDAAVIILIFAISELYFKARLRHA